MILNKYTFFTNTGELREEEMEVLEEREDRFWVQDYMGAKIVSKSEIDKAVNNPIYDNIRVYTTGSKETAVSVILKEYWKHVNRAEKEYAEQKQKMVSNLSVLEGYLSKNPNFLPCQETLKSFANGELAIHIRNSMEYLSFIHLLEANEISLSNSVDWQADASFYEDSYPYYFMENPQDHYMNANQNKKNLKKYYGISKFVELSNMQMSEQEKDVVCTEEETER